MKILCLAPHPFYQERGTPIAVDLLLAALSARGDDVDVATFHEGIDRSYDGPGRVRIFRIPPPRGARNIRPGFSIKKVISDMALYRMAVQLAAQNRYDAVHAVEESAFIAIRLKKRFGIPYVYDMDSCMPRQIVDKIPLAWPALPLMNLFERRAVREASAVAVMCDALAELATGYGATNVFTLRDVPLLDEAAVRTARHPAPGRTGGATECRIVYIGNLERYQGIDLLLESFARMPAATAARLVIIGGIPKHIQEYENRAEKLGIRGRVEFTGPRPVSEMASAMADADILVSPRTQGTNTPMKIYSYMASGKPVVATDLSTHTQVLDASMAELCKPEPAAMAEAMMRLIRDPRLREQRAGNALRAVQEKYSLPVFRREVDALYQSMQQVKALTGAGGS